MENINTPNYKDSDVLTKIVERKTNIVIGEIDDDQLIDSLIIEAKDKLKESTVSGKTNVRAEHTDFRALTYSPNFHSFLLKIKSSIKKIYEKKFEVREVWANIYKEPNKDYAITHSHADTSAFCGVLYCTDGPGPGTYFNDYDLTIQEKKGRFILFSPILLHEVRPYDYKKERITIAFNFFQIREWDSHASLKTYSIGGDIET